MKNALISSHLLTESHSSHSITKCKEISIIGLEPTLSHNQACHKILTYHFNNFLKYESMLLDGESYTDSYVVHDMRVTIRRIESSLCIFQQDFKAEFVILLKNSLKNIIHRLSRIRDLDVFMKNLACYQAKLINHSLLDDEENIAFMYLMESFKHQRDRALKRVIILLQSKEHVKFKRKIDKFLILLVKNKKYSTFHKDAPYKIRHIAFSSIYKSYEKIRIRDESLKNATIDQLHDFRKDCKHLRYLIENFQDILGSQSSQVLDEIKKVQDYLGELNDAKVARELLLYYCSHDACFEKNVMPLHIEAYLLELENKQKFLLGNFPTFWHQINTLKLRRQIALAIAEL